MSLVSRAAAATAAAVALALAVSAEARPPVRGAHAASRVHEIHMEMSGSSFRFAPSMLSVARGDTVVFVVASGEPHDVAFDTSAMSATAKQKLNAKIHEPIAPFAGPLLVHRGDRFVMDTGDLPPGEYPFYCLPHLALQMKGVVTIK